MRWLTSLMVLAGILLISPVQAALPKHFESVQPLMSNDRAICTTWSADEKRGIWITAGHCVASLVTDLDTGETFTLTWPLAIDGQPAEVTKLSPLGEWDIAVMKTNVHYPALKLGNYPRMGDEVTVYGFPGGFRTPIPTWIRVSNGFQQWAPDMRMPWIASMLFDGNIWPGHSGSPILDRKGRVISMAQGGFLDRFAGLNLGIPWSILRGFLIDSGVDVG